jgi:hypothetical protein
MSPITSKYSNTSDMGNPFSVPGEISLDLPHLQLYWHNGKSEAGTDKGVYHFGGWFCGADEILAAIENFAPVKLDTIGFKGPDTWHGRKESEYQSYHIRSIYVAPIAPREVWRQVVNDKGEKKWRSTYSMLGFMAYLSEKKFKFLGPVVISGSSYSGEAVKNAIMSFPALTAEARRVAAPTVPAWQWYIPIGTFGPKRISRIVGKGNSSSPIVPAQIYNPDGGWKPETIEHYFVSDDVADQMKATKDAAQEWLAWKPDKTKDEELSMVVPGEDFPA